MFKFSLFVILEPCELSSLMSNFHNISCASVDSHVNEETNDYDESWLKPKDFKDTPLYHHTKPWRYQDSSMLDGHPTWAALDVYPGGGYVVELFPKWNNSAILSQLKKQRWLDRLSRALIVEFTLFNPSTNLFNYVSIVFEFPPSGGLVHFHRVLSFSLYRTAIGTDSWFLVMCEFTYFFLLFLFFVRAVKQIYRRRMAYFSEFWNLVEVAVLVLAYMAVGFYFKREKLGKELISRVSFKKPDIFINFQEAVYWDLLYRYIVAVIVFFVMLKFVTLLRFNKRIRMLSRTLEIAGGPLKCFGITICKLN